MYAVVDKDNRVCYVGEDRDKAINTFEANPGSTMEKPETIEDYQELLSLIGSHNGCCGHTHVATDPTSVEVEAMITEVLAGIKKQFSGVSDKVCSVLEELGITRETVTEFWTEAKQEISQIATELSAEAEKNPKWVNGRKTVVDVCDKLTKVGNALVEKYKNRT